MNDNPASPATRENVSDLRVETADLVRAVDQLAGKLDQTVTRDEVAQDLAIRMAQLESGLAQVLAGTKNQIQRTRRAAWIFWGFLLVLTGFVTIQVHDIHISECMLNAEKSAATAFICEATFPFHDHEGIDLPVAHQHEYEFAVSPRVVGVGAYGLLFAGVLGGFALYRRRSRDEGHLETGLISPGDLATMTLAQQDKETTKSREDNTP